MLFAYQIDATVNQCVNIVKYFEAIIQGRFNGITFTQNGSLPGAFIG